MADRVLVAPDKFKGSLAATEVAARVAAGLSRAGFRGEVVQLPVADGGDGTVDAAVSAGYRRVELEVRGPTGRPRSRCSTRRRSSRRRRRPGCRCWRRDSSRR
jgi:glycerate kinase